MKKLLLLLPSLIFMTSLLHADLHVHSRMTVTNLPQEVTWHADMSWDIADALVLDGTSEWSTIIFGDDDEHIFLTVSGDQTKLVLMSRNEDGTWSEEDELVMALVPGVPCTFDLSAAEIQIRIVVMLDAQETE